MQSNAVLILYFYLIFDSRKSDCVNHQSIFYINGGQDWFKGSYSSGLALKASTFYSITVIEL